MLIIPVGTQIVTLLESKVINEDRFQPRGAVGIIKTAPKDATHSYVLEFLDGSISSMKRQGFAIRKEFQSDNAIEKSDDIDLEKYIVYKCVVGSRAFGLDDEKSDTDYRGIYLPPADIHWSLYGIPEQIEKKESEECYWELQKFLVLALKANPNILECLNTPMIEFKAPIAEELLSIKDAFISKLLYQTYNGYVMSQFKKMEQDLRNNGSIRPKHAMHLIRLLLQGIEILRSGKLEVKVSDHREQLLDIKSGAMPWEKTNEWRLALHKEFESAFAESRLPERPDYEKANDFLIRARRSVL